VRAEDIGRIVEIEKASFKDAYPRSLLENLMTLSPEGFLVAVWEGRIIGYVSSIVERRHTARLVSVAVHPHYRRRGVAWRLMAELVKTLKNKDVDEVLLEVRESNKAAIRLYKSLGFQPRKILQKYYEDGENALVMSLRLKPPSATENL
jgi:ribosomal-protein-alanine N-acetyltransferase